MFEKSDQARQPKQCAQKYFKQTRAYENEINDTMKKDALKTNVS